MNDILISMRRRDTYLINHELIEQLPDYVGAVEECHDLSNSNELPYAEDRLKIFQALHAHFRGKTWAEYLYSDGRFEWSDPSEITIILTIDESYLLGSIVSSMCRKYLGRSKLSKEANVDLNDDLASLKKLSSQLVETRHTYYERLEKEYWDRIKIHKEQIPPFGEVWIRRKGSTAPLICYSGVQENWLERDATDIACFISKQFGEGNYEVLFGGEALPLTIIGDDHQCPIPGHCKTKEYYTSPFTGKTE